MQDNKIEEILSLDPRNLLWKVSFIASKSAVGAVLGHDDECEGMTIEKGFFSRNIVIETIISNELIPRFLEHSPRWEFTPRKGGKSSKAKIFFR